MTLATGCLLALGDYNAIRRQFNLTELLALVVWTIIATVMIVMIMMVMMMMIIIIA